MARADAGATKLRGDAAASNAEGSGLAAEHFAGTGEEALRRRAFVARLCSAELVQELFLLRRHSRRCLDQDTGDEVAAPAAVKNAHARAAMPELLTRLQPGRDFHLDGLAVDSRKLDRATQRGRREADGAFRDQRRGFARINRMPLHVDEDVEVAASRAAYPRFTLTGDADPRAFVDTGRNFHRQLALAVHATLALAARARVGNDFAS